MKKSPITIGELAISHPMAALDSSCLAGAGWDEESGVLYVTFASSGWTYLYDGVSEGAYRRLIEAGSPGGEFASGIKGKYPCDGQPYRIDPNVHS